MTFSFGDRKVEDFVRAVRENDNAAVKEFFRDNQDKMEDIVAARAMAGPMVGYRKDILQEAWLQIVRAIKRGKDFENLEHLTATFSLCARNKTITIARNKWVKRDMQPLEFEDGEEPASFRNRKAVPDPSKLVEDKLELETLRGVNVHLTTKEQVLLDQIREGKNFPDILNDRKLNIGSKERNAAKDELHRLYHKIVAKFQDKLNEPSGRG